MLWGEPRPSGARGRGWRDAALVGVLATWSLVEALLRDDLGSRPLALLEAEVVALSLLWRRTHPLAAVVAAFATLAAIDVVRLATSYDVGRLWSVAAVLVLPYALCRWASGREVALGLGVVSVWAGLTHLAWPVEPAEAMAGYGFFLFAGALGIAMRLQAGARAHQVEQVKLRERQELARELHDAVGHYVSAIAVQAQAGRVVSTTDPGRAATVLQTIEEISARALAELRGMVGVLRDPAESALSPQPGLADIEHLAGAVEGEARVEVRLTGELTDVAPAVQRALFRIAQESVTNAVRHARHATRVTIEVSDEGERVRQTVRDDGTTAVGPAPRRGHGIAGMAERAELLGGRLQVGPDPDGGWTVTAWLPKSP